MIKITRKSHAYSMLMQVTYDEWRSLLSEGNKKLIRQ